MDRHAPQSRSTLSRAAGLCAALLLAAPPPAARAADRYDAVSPAPRLTGVWRRDGGSNMFDPTAREDTQSPPYRPEWAAKYREIRERAKQGLEVYDATADCIPTGMPRTMNAVYGFEVLQTPGQVTIIAEYFGETRRIFTDGRGHPAGDDLEPSFVGHSIGRWEGDVLVVDTVAIKGGTALDSSLAPRSDKAHIVERIRMTGPDTFEDRITYEDPVALERPWTVTKTYKRAPAGEYVREYVCTENNRKFAGEGSAR